MAARKKKEQEAPKIASEHGELVVSEAEYFSRLQEMKGADDPDFSFADDELLGLSSVNEWFSTGSLALDRQMGGGWPVGRISECAAWESVGKSTIIDQTIASAQQFGAVDVHGDRASQRAITALADSEKARDTKYTRSLGVDLARLIVSPVDTVEQGFDACDRFLDVQEDFVAKGAKASKPPPLLLIWDSLGGTPALAELEGAADDTHVSPQARKIKQNFRRLCIRLAKLRAGLVFTNQFYQSIGSKGLTTTGGGGVRYFTSLRVWLTRGDNLKSGDNHYGHIVKSRIRKTRITRPQPDIDLGLIYGAGIDNAYTLFEWGKTRGPQPGHNWIQTRGAWQYVMHPETGEVKGFQGGSLGLARILAEDTHLYRMLATLYRIEGEE